MKVEYWCQQGSQDQGGEFSSQIQLEAAGDPPGGGDGSLSPVHSDT